MSKIELNADLTQAIEQVANKLGMAANEIIPCYTKLELVRGLSWGIGGLLLTTLPWFLFLFSPEWKDGMAYGLWWVGRMIFCVITTWSGGFTITDNIKNIVAPKAMAINRLLTQLR